MADLSFWEYVIILAGSFLAGVINILAGSGSAITLSILTELLGLPGNVANGTNRIGILLACYAAFISFYKNKKFEYERSWLIVVCVVLGAIAGVIVAAFYTTDEAFMDVFRVMMLLLLPIVLLRPKRWLQSNAPKANSASVWIRVPLYLALGFYAGFIQMGMGIFFLATVVLLDKFNIISGNVAKNLAVTVLTTIVVVIFHIRGLIDWQLGMLLAIGQVIGAYLAAQFASKYKHADIWAYRLLVLIIIVVNLRLFGVIF